MSKTPAPITTSDALAAAVKRAATAKPGTTHLRVAVPGAGTTLKATSDRIRRLPRQNGWHALNVQVVEQSAGVITFQVTTLDETAVPWPTKSSANGAALVADIVAEPAPAKRATKSTTKSAPAKRTAKTSAAGSTSTRRGRKAPRTITAASLIPVSDPDDHTAGALVSELVESEAK